MNEGEQLTQAIAHTISGIGLGAGTIGAVIGLVAATAVLIALLTGNPRMMSIVLPLWLVGSILALGGLVVALWHLTVVAVAAAPVAVILGVAVRLMLVRRAPVGAGIHRGDRPLARGEALA